MTLGYYIYLQHPTNHKYPSYLLFNLSANKFIYTYPLKRMVGDNLLKRRLILLSMLMYLFTEEIKKRLNL